MEAHAITETLIWNTPMAVSAVILIATFIGIFTEGVHGFHRTKFAMGGSVLMILFGQYFGFYSPELAIESIDWNVVFLLGAMMSIVAVMIPTGGFQSLAYRIADLSRGRLFLLLTMLGTAVTLISLLLDNVTTVVIFGPLIVLICRALKVSPIPYLLAAALLSDTGGVATLVGDPPNLMIGSAADINFNTFLVHMGLIVLVAWIAILIGMEQQGINVTPLWWSLAIGVGMGGNGTHLGSTANVFIVTLSERLAKDTGDESLRITPGLWFRKGTPVMLLTLLTSSVCMWLFFDFFSASIH